LKKEVRTILKSLAGNLLAEEKVENRINKKLE